MQFKHLNNNGIKDIFDMIKSIIPTKASDVGAFPTTGGTISGNLTVNGNLAGSAALTTPEQVAANTAAGKFASAVAVKTMANNMGVSVKDDKLVWTNAWGADTVIPFSGGAVNYFSNYDPKKILLSGNSTGSSIMAGKHYLYISNRIRNSGDANENDIVTNTNFEVLWKSDMIVGQLGSKVITRVFFIKALKSVAAGGWGYQTAVLIPVD